MYTEIDDILTAQECTTVVDTITNFMSSPDGIFNRVFAHTNESLSLLVKDRLALRGYDMRDTHLSKTWYYTVYQQGESLAPHIDGRKREGEYHSIKTVLIYLNMHPSFDGGSTCVLGHHITPRTGKGLILSQDVLHEGKEVTKGTKYVIRGDIMVRSHT